MFRILKKFLRLQLPIMKLEELQILSKITAEHKKINTDKFKRSNLSPFLPSCITSKKLIWTYIYIIKKVSEVEETPFTSSLNVCPEACRARICKRLRSLGINSEDSIPPGWESIRGLLKRFTNTGSRERGGDALSNACSAQTVTRIGLLEEIPRSGVQIPCLY